MLARGANALAYTPKNEKRGGKSFVDFERRITSAIRLSDAIRVSPFFLFLACSVPGRGSPRFRVFRIFIFSSTFSPAKRQRKSRRESVEFEIKKIVDFFLKNFEEF